MSNAFDAFLGLFAGSAEEPARACCVERACDAFHAAQASVVALLDTPENFRTSAIDLHRACRDEALRQVRSRPVRTKRALEAKISVLRVMANCLSIEDVGVAAFSFELVFETSDFLKKEIGDDRGCKLCPDWHRNDAR